jgi:hypothetical protein
MERKILFSQIKLTALIALDALLLAILLFIALL